MIFCAFLDPESIQAAAAAGAVGEDHLIGVLRCLLQNCLIAETQTWRVGSGLKEAVESVKGQDARTKIIALLGEFDKRSRLVAVLEGFEEDYDTPLSAIASANASNSNLDVIVSQTVRPNAGAVEVTPIESFNQSNFAQNRQRLSCGVFLGANETNPPSFFSTYFGKLHLAVASFHVIDYAIGSTGFTDNFYRNLPFWIDFLRQSPDPVRFTIHTEQGSVSEIRSLNARLAELTDSSNVVAAVKVHTGLPHERFLVTAAFSFDIGRGIDLFDPRTNLNRDIRLGLSQKHFSFCT